MAERHTILVTVGRELFEFASQQDWINHATQRFRAARHDSANTLCVTSDGEAIINGGGFRRAGERGAYPVTVYSLREEE